MSRRNAHAVAARRRNAGPHGKVDETASCPECGRDMGYSPPSQLCAPCYLGIRPETKLCAICKKKPQAGAHTNLCHPCLRGVPVEIPEGQGE